MNEKTYFDIEIEKYKNDPYFQLQGVLLDITEKIAIIMQVKNMSYSDLAKKMNVNKSYISRIMNCDENMSLKTLIKISMALDCKVSVSMTSASDIEEIKIFDNNSMIEPNNLKEKKINVIPIAA